MPRYIVRNDYGTGRSVGTKPLTRREAIDSLMERTGALEEECAAAVDSLVPAPVVVPRHGSPRALTGAASVELLLD